MFSETTLEKVRNLSDIVDVIGEYVQLKKSGQGYTGLCPFHGEKTPSFHVHPVKQIFHCFGCHKGGNVFSFLCAVEGLSFPEVVERLAKRAGVEIEHETRYRREVTKVVIPGEDKLVAAMEWAAKYFHFLLNENPEYAHAKKYLKARGISQKSIDRFRIGVSPKGWNTLMNLMLKRKFTFGELTQAGLVVPKEGPNQGYDRFRERLMFPILDKEGRVIAFGARLLNDEPNQPKYLNSNESPLFSKRKNLYGIHENQRGIRLREEAVIVEGYMDVVGLYEAGVDNALATMGTALTEEHCAQIKGLTHKVVTVFDPDSAGTDASKRSVHFFLSAGIFAKDLTLPDNKDPDEFVLAHGAEKFYELCRDAPRQVTKLLREIASRGTLSEEESGKLLQELVPILRASRRLPDRAVLWDNISLIFRVSLATIKDLAEGGNQPSKTPVPDVRKPGTRPAPPRKPTTHPMDLEFFAACVRSPEEFLRTPRDRWEGTLRSEELSQWLVKLHECPSLIEFQAVLTQMVHQAPNPEWVARATEGLVQEGASKTETPFPAMLERMAKRKKEMEIHALSTQVRLSERLGNPEEQLKLLERLKELRTS